jgi:hypothetical protein
LLDLYLAEVTWERRPGYEEPRLVLAEDCADCGVMIPVRHDWMDRVVNPTHTATRFFISCPYCGGDIGQGAYRQRHGEHFKSEWVEALKTW